MAWIPTTDLFDVLLNEPVGVTLTLFQNVLSCCAGPTRFIVNEVVHKEKMALIGEMAGSLMHDLRSPVQVILSSVELIKGVAARRVFRFGADDQPRALLTCEIGLHSATASRLRNPIPNNMGHDPGQPYPSNTWMNARMLRIEATWMPFADRSDTGTCIPK